MRRTARPSRRGDARGARFGEARPRSGTARSPRSRTSVEEAPAPPPQSRHRSIGQPNQLAGPLRRADSRPAGESRLRRAARQAEVARQIRPRGTGAAGTAAARRVADAEVVAVAAAAVGAIAAPAAVRRARAARVDALRAVALILSEALPRPSRQSRRVRAADQFVQTRPIDPGVARAAVVFAVARFGALRADAKPDGEERRPRSRHPTEHATP